MTTPTRFPIRVVLGGLLAVCLAVGGTVGIAMLAPAEVGVPHEVPTSSSPTPPPRPRLPSPIEPVPAGAQAAAERFTSAFLRRAGDRSDQWLARLAPVTTEEFLGVLATEGNVDAAPAKLIGKPVPIGAAPGSAVVIVVTDQGPLRIELVVGDRGWLVADVDDVVLP